MAIKLSCSDYTWPGLQHATVMSVIADLGFDGVDIGVFNTQTHVTVPAIIENPSACAEDVLRISGRAGLRVSDVFLTAADTLESLSPTSRRKADWDQLQKIFEALIEFAVVVGSSGITMLPGVIENGVSPEEARDLSAERLSVLIGLAADSGLATSVEPHVGSIIEDPKSTLELLEMCPGLTVTLDPSHFGFLGWPVSSLIPLIARTRHVQVRPAALGVMQTRLVDNQLDLELLICELVKQDYQGWIASEFVWMEKWGCDRVDNTSETKFLGQFLRNLLSKSKKEN